MKSRKLQSIRELDPVLVVYVSDRIELAKLNVPVNLELQELVDLRKRYQLAIESDTKRLKTEAKQLLSSLEDDNIKNQIGPDEYQRQLDRISELVKRHRELIAQQSEGKRSTAKNSPEPVSPTTTPNSTSPETEAEASAKPKSQNQ